MFIKKIISFNMDRYLSLLLFIGLTHLGCDNNEGCIDESKISDASTCTEEYQPVCGCDGLTWRMAF